MEEIKKSITINASRDKVWEVLTTHPLVDEWNDAFMSGSKVTGEFSLNSELLYQGSDNGGMKTVIKEFVPGEKLVNVGTAVVNDKGDELKAGDKDYDDYKDWIGSADTYELSEADGQTTLTVTTTIPDPSMVDTFNESWERALAKIKELAEKE
jgi:uncharacterized protein YndB with AHSA1/START domain